LGVTATPSRLDGAPLGDTFKSLLQYGQLMKFVEDGYLASMRHFATGSPELSEVRVKNTGDYDEKLLYSAMNSELVMADIIKGYEFHAKNKKAIVFAVNTEHAQNIANRFNEKGYKAVALDYKTDAQDRKDLVDQFKRGEIQILCNVNLFTEGFDCPDVEVVQLARPTKSLNLYLQMIGRGMRVYPGKEYGIILDNAMLWQEHGLYSRERIWDFNGFKKDSKNIKIIEKGEKESSSDVPMESDSFELIEIIDEYNSNRAMQNTNLDFLVFPFLLFDLNRAFDIYSKLKIKTISLKPFDEQFENFLTGKKMSARAVLNMIDPNICNDNRSISTSKFIQIIRDYSAKFSNNDFTKQTTFYFITRWQEKPRIYEKTVSEVSQSNSIMKIVKTLITERNSLADLEIEEGFIENEGDIIHREQIEVIYEKLHKKYYDLVINEIKRINEM
jgi:type I site-specific restriction endonuclease